MTTSIAPSLAEPRRSALAEPRLAAYLPLIHAAWAADELAALVTGLRQAGQGLPDAGRGSLAALGGKLAAHRGAPLELGECEALIDIESTLGVAGTEAAQGLVTTGRKEPAIAPPAAPFDVTALTKFLDGEQHGTRERLRRLLASPEFAYRSELDRETYRPQVLSWCQRLAAEGVGLLGLPREHDGGGDPASFLAAFETLAHHDLSLVVKFGVQFGLFAGSIHQLGSERHHAAYLPAAGRLDLPGSFAMTETGHFSSPCMPWRGSRPTPAGCWSMASSKRERLAPPESRWTPFARSCAPPPSAWSTLSRSRTRSSRRQSQFGFRNGGPGLTLGSHDVRLRKIVALEQERLS